MNQREREADGEPGESDRRALVRRAENDDQEHERHHHFAHEPCRERIAARRVRAVAVGGEPAGEAEIRAAARDEVQHAGADDATHDLRDDVRQEQRWPGNACRPTSRRETAGLK